LFHSKLLKTINYATNLEISDSRKLILKELVKYIKTKKASKSEVHLNFICTHNSRRSQFCQIWAETASAYYNKKIYCYSGGLVVTEFNINAVNTMKKCGFDVIKSGSKNPTYSLYYSNSRVRPISVFSKLYNDPVNKANSFAAITTCSDAEENCPFILNAKKRIFLEYDDPKLFDNLPNKMEKYFDCSFQIASELFYVFRNVE
tara:strand:+ start:315 stop:923 length:609 start_codon:yes stop_codon:yes gene_type:complete